MYHSLGGQKQLPPIGTSKSLFVLLYFVMHVSILSVHYVQADARVTAKVKFLGGRHFAVSHCRRMHVNIGEGMKTQWLWKVNVCRYGE